MQAFDYQPRTRVIFGAGSLERLGEAAHSLGGTRALVVSDPRIMATGYTGRAVEGLEAAGLKAFGFTDVEKDPTTRHVDAGVAAAREHQIDLIVGLGGGSSMDCAKGINFLVTNGGRMADYWGIGKATKPMLPLIAVPTTAGTGSEAQSFALIANEKTRQKMACGDPKAAPAAAILDPDLTLTQPPDITAVTGIDAITHAVETWVTKKRNPVSELFSCQAWHLLSENFPVVLREPNNRAARAGMLLGSHYARRGHRKLHARRGTFLRQPADSSPRRNTWSGGGHDASWRYSVQRSRGWRSLYTIGRGFGWSGRFGSNDRGLDAAGRASYAPLAVRYFARSLAAAGRRSFQPMDGELQSSPGHRAGIAGDL